MKQKVNIGVIGAGRIGRLHTQNLVMRVPNAQVLCIADINKDAAEQCAIEYEVPKIVEDYRMILDDRNIDAVVICSSTDTHAQIIGEAATSGKHVFCEKPIDYNLARIDTALAKVASAGIKLQIGFQRRFDPNFLRVHRLVHEGRLGDPYVLRITSRDPQPSSIEYIKSSGGLFLDMMIHDFDMARFLSGKEVVEIYATGRVNIDPQIGEAGDIDTAMVLMKFSSGIMGTIDCCRKSGYGYDQRVELFGSEGMARVENETPDRISIANSASIQSELPLFFFIERYSEAYVAEIREFICCILEDKIPLVSGLDGRIPVVLGKAAKKSMVENRPVTITGNEQ